MIETTEQSELGSALRAALEPIAGDTDRVAAVLLDEFGLRGLTVTEAAGGLGASAGDVAAAAFEIGYTLANDPLLGPELQARRMLDAAGTNEARAAVRRSLDAGRSWALVPAGTVTVALEGGVLRVTGAAAALPGPVADGYVVVAGPAAEPTLLVVAGDASGVRAAPDERLLDPRRPQHSVTFVAAPAERVALEVRLALAAEQAGGARRCLDDAVAYAKDRYQFGRPIGSFQGPKHRMAVMFQRAQCAYIAVRKAADLLDAGDPGAAEAIEVAAVWAGPAYTRNAAESLDIHGGIGFTVELDCHLHIRRSRAAGALFGGTAAVRRGLADRLLPA